MDKEPTAKKCECYWCVNVYPKIKQVANALAGENLIAFNWLMEHYEAQGMDGDVAQAKLDGVWPGWEAMKDFKPTYKDADVS